MQPRHASRASTDLDAAAAKSLVPTLDGSIGRRNRSTPQNARIVHQTHVLLNTSTYGTYGSSQMQAAWLANTEQENAMTAGIIAPETALELPLDITGMAEVDDAGGVHLETVMTAGYLVDLNRSGLLALTGNIRPQHNAPTLKGKTRSKVDRWTRELLDNNAVIGNISIRLNPETSSYEVLVDEETGDRYLHLENGIFDCAVDSLSRIKAILSAAQAPTQTFDLATRFQVRIWLTNNDDSARVATIYNTRGDKVNDSAAKWAFSETPEQQIARKLVNSSEHLGQDNVEVLANSVSSRSNKLTAFNTISKGIELFWAAGPITNADVEAQAAWLISAWNSLVKIRPEFGIMSTPARQAVRATSVAGSAVSIHAVIAAMSALYSQGIDPEEAFTKLKQQPTEEVDFFTFANPAWTNAGVIAKSGSDGNYSVRTSFPTRRAAAKLVGERIGVSATSI